MAASSIDLPWIPSSQHLPWRTFKKRFPLNYGAPGAAPLLSALFRQPLISQGPLQSVVPPSARFKIVIARVGQASSTSQFALNLPSLTYWGLLSTWTDEVSPVTTAPRPYSELSVCNQTEQLHLSMCTGAYGYVIWPECPELSRVGSDFFRE